MSSPALFFLDPMLPQPLSAKVAALLVGAGGEVAKSTDAGSALCVVPGLQAAGAAGSRRVVALIDGALGADHVSFLEREPPTLFWACGEDGSPVEADAKALVSLYLGRPLIGGMGQVLLRAKVNAFSGIAASSEAARALAERNGATAAACSAVSDVMYEIVANAILDAPVGPDGEPRYAYKRDSQPVIAPEDACEIAVGVAKDRMLVTAVDRFGRLGVAPFVRTIAKLGERARINDAGGGAGLGIRRILEHSELVVVRVAPGRATQVLSVVAMGSTSRKRKATPKSLFLWMERG